MWYFKCVVNLVAINLFSIISEVQSVQRYIVAQEPVNWYQALINCKNAGMELASIHSEQEKKTLEKFLKDNGHNKGYWLAGTKQGNGEYYWATSGTKVLYTNWLAGQPDDAKIDHNFNKGEDCIQWGMPTYSPEPTGWNDLECDQTLPYICQNYEYCYESNDVIF